MKSEWKSALSKYHTAILYLKGLDTSQLNSRGVPSTTIKDEEKKKIKDILTAIHSNMAAVYLKEGKPEKALKSCQDALKLKADHAKSVFRMGLALKLMDRLDESAKKLVEAVKLAPNDAGVRKELDVVKDLITKADARSKEELKANMKNMYS